MRHIRGGNYLPQPGSNSAFMNQTADDGALNQFHSHNKKNSVRPASEERLEGTTVAEKRAHTHHTTENTTASAFQEHVLMLFSRVPSSQLVLDDELRPLHTARMPPLPGVLRGTLVEAEGGERGGEEAAGGGERREERSRPISGRLTGRDGSQ